MCAMFLLRPTAKNSNSYVLQVFNYRSLCEKADSGIYIAIKAGVSLRRIYTVGVCVYLTAIFMHTSRNN